MALPSKKAAAVQTAPASGVNFGDLSIYVAGGGLPEGNYALEFMAQMYQATDAQGATKGPSRLGIMVTAHSLTDMAAEPKTQFYSMGSKSHESFAPDPDTGKSLVPVAGGPGSGTFNNQTNWAYFLKSLYDSGLPVGVFTNDLTVLDGIHVHVTNIPEPEGRKGFQKANTAEGGSDEPRRAGTVAVVSEILDDGAPWEGGGGIPDRSAPAPKPPAAKVVAKPVAAAKPAVAGKVIGKKPAAPPPPPPAEEVEGITEEDLADAALAAAVAVLEKYPNGTSRVMLQTGMFKHCSSTYSDEVAQMVQDTFFASDEALDTVLNQIEFKVDGKKIVMAA